MWARNSRAVLVLVVLGLTVVSSCVETKMDWTVQASAELGSLEVLGPANAVINFESYKGSSIEECQEIQVAVMVEAESERVLLLDEAGAQALKLTVNSNLGSSLPSRSSSTGQPCWAVVAVTIMTGLGWWKGGHFNTQGRGHGLLLFTLLALGSLALAECPETVSITVRLPTSVCWSRSSPSSINIGDCSQGANSTQMQLDETPETSEMRGRTCPDGGESFTFSLTTDNYAFENSWSLNKKTGEVIVAGPPSGHNYQDDTVYTGSVCLPEGSYSFAIVDNGNDGLCCGFGEGSYGIWVGEETIGLSDPNGELFGRKEFPFTIGEQEVVCDPEVNPSVSITMTTDKYGHETSWMLVGSDGEQIMTGGSIAGDSSKTIESCVPKGDYDFIITDAALDGLCCRYGDGGFEIKVGEKVILHGGQFKEVFSMVMKIGYETPMNDREEQWLEGHNTRRKEWHERFGKSYVPLKWSIGLVADAQVWADQLTIETCWNSKDIYHAKDEVAQNQGENIARNKGNQGTWGQLYTPDQLVGRFVEREAEWDAPANNHLTTALWRASTYVGCAEAISAKEDGSGSLCRTQVCRYIKAGNCALGSSTDPKKMDLVMADDSGCGSLCPSEGCF